MGRGLGHFTAALVELGEADVGVEVALIRFESGLEGRSLAFIIALEAPGFRKV
jgi:hypothetical protein